MHRPVRSTMPALLLVATLSAPLAAQGDSLAVLSGRVVTSSGAAIFGAQIRVVGTSRATTADRAGAFVFPGMPPGTYAVRFSYVGYRPGEVTGLVLRAGETTHRDITLEEGIAPRTIRPVPGEPPGQEELIIRAHWRQRALLLGWPVLRDAPAPADARELRMERRGGMIYRPAELLRLRIGPDSVRGELREVWWHSPDSSGPYQVPIGPGRICDRIDSVTTTCRVESRAINWRAVADSIDRLGVWQHFVDEGVRYDNFGMTDQETLITEATVNGTYRSASYYGAGAFVSAQTSALLGVSRMLMRGLDRITPLRLGR